MKRSVVHRSDRAWIVCPACGRRRALGGASQKVKSRTLVQVRCCCGNNFETILDRRLFLRATASLPGRYWVEGGDELAGRLLVRDLSVGGLGLVLEGKVEVKPGQRLRIEYAPEPDSAQLLVRDVVVRRVVGQWVGVELIAK